MVHGRDVNNDLSWSELLSVQCILDVDVTPCTTQIVSFCAVQMVQVVLS